MKKPDREYLNLQGEWQFALDPRLKGEEHEWYAKDMGDTIPLPSW